VSFEELVNKASLRVKGENEELEKGDGLFMPSGEGVLKDVLELVDDVLEVVAQEELARVDGGVGEPDEVNQGRLANLGNELPEADHLRKASDGHRTDVDKVIIVKRVSDFRADLVA